MGSREWTSESDVRNTILDTIKHIRPAGHRIRIVSGGARGVDSIGAQYACDAKLIFKLHPAEWSKYGKSAGYKRNILIVKDADIVLAFKNPGSKGTQHTIDIANHQGVPCMEFAPTDFTEKGGD